MSLLDDVSIVVTPNGYKAGTLYAVKPTDALGSELIVNGDFATDSDWTYTTGVNQSWSISGGTANSSGTQSGLAYFNQNGAIVSGKIYKATFTVVSRSAGGVLIAVGGTSGTTRTATGTYTEYLTAASNQLWLRADSNFAGSIDNVSVKEFTGADMDVTRATAATRVDENGLVNYAEVLGSEEVENGDGSSTTGWDSAYANTTLSINNNNLRATANSSGAYGLSQDLSLDTSKQYIIKATINVDNASGGAANLRIATNSSLSSGVTTLSSTTGTTTTILSPSAATMYIGIVDTANDSSNYVEIDNISVKEIDRNNVPRIDYTGGGCPHILAEPQRTNQSLNSNDISQLSTIISGGSITVTGNYAVSPDGTQDATRVVASSTGSNYALVSTTAVTSTAGTYVGSIYLKSNNGSNQNVAFYARNASVNYVTITPNWERYNVLGSVSSNFINFGARTSYGSDSSLDFLAWGLQIEHGSYATSLIPTSGSTVTRNQDIFTRDGIASLINSTEGVLFVEMAALENVNDDERTVSLSDGTNVNTIRLQFNTLNNNVRVFVGNGVTQVNSNITISDITVFNKFAFKYKQNDFALWINGSEVITDTSGSTFAAGTLNKLGFVRGDNTEYLFGKVKQLQVYKTALTDAQLTSLTT